MIARTGYLLVATAFVGLFTTACSDAATGPTQAVQRSGPSVIARQSGSSGGGGSIAPACGTVTKYTTSVGARNGSATVQASINLAPACPTGGIGIIKVTIVNDVTGVSADMWDGTFLSAYGFNASYLTADFNTSYTIIVVASGVTTTLPSVTTGAFKL